MQWDCVRGVRLLWAVEVRGAVLAEGSLDRAWKDSRIGKRKKLSKDTALDKV